jgi:hypothetical protein
MASTVIYDSASHTAYWLLSSHSAPSHKGYVALPVNQGTPLAARNDEMMRVSRVGSETIAGVRCDDYEGVDDSGIRRWACVVPDMGTFPLFGMLMRGQQDLRPNGPPFADLFARGNFPLAMGTIDRGTRTVKLVATTVRRTALDPSLFTVPSDYAYGSGLFVSPVAVRVVDEHRILMYAAVNQDKPVLALFLMHTAQAVTPSVARDLASSDLSLRHNTELLIPDRDHRRPDLLFSVDNDRNDHGLAAEHADAERIPVTGLAGYFPGPITASAIARLQPTDDCVGVPRGSCYEADGHRIVFP